MITCNHKTAYSNKFLRFFSNWITFIRYIILNQEEYHTLLYFFLQILKIKLIQYLIFIFSLLSLIISLLWYKTCYESQSFYNSHDQFSNFEEDISVSLFIRNAFSKDEWNLVYLRSSSLAIFHACFFSICELILKVKFCCKIEEYFLISYIRDYFLSKIYFITRISFYLPLFLLNFKI